MATAAVKRPGYRAPRTAYSRGPGSVSYDGNAARVLDGAEILQPRPQVRTRERAVERPRAQVREAGQVSVFAVAGFLAVGVFAALVLLCSVRLTTLSDQVVALNNQVTALQNEEAKLRARYELAFDVAAIEQAMTASGAMVKPQSGQIVYLDLSEPDSVVLFQDQQAATGLAGAAEGARNALEYLVEYFR